MHVVLLQKLSVFFLIRYAALSGLAEFIDLESQGFGLGFHISPFQGRPRADGRAKAVTGHYRRLMQQRFPKKLYGQRWQIETTFSMIKRNLGSSLRARRYQSQSREIRLRILTHNLAVLKRLWHVLYRAGASPIPLGHLAGGIFGLRMMRAQL